MDEVRAMWSLAPVLLVVAGCQAQAATRAEVDKSRNDAAPAVTPLTLAAGDAGAAALSADELERMLDALEQEPAPR
jgi:hypothetical protein